MLLREMVCLYNVEADLSRKFCIQMLLWKKDKNLIFIARIASLRKHTLPKHLHNWKEKKVWFNNMNNFKWVWIKRIKFYKRLETLPRNCCFFFLSCTYLISDLIIFICLYYKIRWFYKNEIALKFVNNSNSFVTFKRKRIIYCCFIWIWYLLISTAHDV